jgi:hypothetical protein
VLYNYRLITILIFLSTSFAYFFPDFIKDYGFLGYDLPIAQSYHSSPYFFALWGVNLLGSVSIYVIYYGIITITISTVKALGRIYFQVCSFVLCGSKLCETGFVIMMFIFIFYSSICNIVVIMLFMHYMIITYRGRLSSQPSETVDRTLTVFQLMALTHLTLLLDYAVFE